MKWTKDKCLELALKYTYKSEFIKNDGNAYSAAFKKGFLDEICQHMKQKTYHGYWTKEKCLEIALKYNTKTLFLKSNPSAYYYAQMHNFLDEICQHMEVIGHHYKRCIYVYEFSDNSAYIGLTYNINERHKQHLKDIKSTVYKYILSTNIKPKLIQLSDYIDKNDASKLENKIIEKYKKNNWIILNKNKGGSLGSKNILISKEYCQEIALKYNTIKDFKSNNINVYNISIKRKWIKDITIHMVELKRPANYWSFEKCQEESLKYNNKNQFCKNAGGAYNKSRKMNWLNLFFPATKS